MLLLKGLLCDHVTYFFFYLKKFSLTTLKMNALDGQPLGGLPARSNSWILFKTIILFGVHLKIMSQLTIPNDVIEELKRT